MLKTNNLNSKRMVFWPDNLMYISFAFMLTAGLFALFVNYLSLPIMPFPVFIILASGLFFYSQRIVIDDEYVYGPSAYGRRRLRIKIPRPDVETFFEKKLWFGNIAIRHKHSSNQIWVPYFFYSKEVIEKLKVILLG